MRIHNHQGNKLFLVCPFCQMENFIIKHYGKVFFLTAPAAMFDFKSYSLQAIKEFITKENIKEIYLVGETSCNFTKNIMDDENHSGLECEIEIENLKSDNDSLFSLTEKMLKEQANELRSNNLFGKEIEDGNILLHILIIDKGENRIKEIALNSGISNFI
jgi:carbonic anhydrase